MSLLHKYVCNMPEIRIAITIHPLSMRYNFQVLPSNPYMPVSVITKPREHMSASIIGDIEVAIISIPNTIFVTKPEMTEPPMANPIFVSPDSIFASIISIDNPVCSIQIVPSTFGLYQIIPIIIHITTPIPTGSHAKSMLIMLTTEGVGSCALPITQTLCAVCW